MRLYNEHAVLDPDGQAFQAEVRRAAKALVALCREKDYDLRDAELLAIQEVGLVFSEEVLRRAAKRRKETR